MGYELNRLMKQYGVATPTMAVAPQMPGAAPVEADYTGKEGSPGDAAKYATDKTAFDESIRKYGLAQKEYDQYKDAYQGRLANTNMYNQAQFSTTGAKVPAITTFSPMQKHAMGYGTAPTDAEGNVIPASQSGFGIGQEAANKNIRDWMAANPNVSPAEFADVKQRYGVNDYDVRNAMGTGTQYGTPQWTDTVQAPTYGVAPISLAGKSAQDKADWYLGQRGVGYTDADLRAGGEKTFGKIGDVDWSALLNTAYPQYVDPVNAAYAQLGRSGFGTNINQIDNPGYNYWMNQLSTGAVKPEDLNTAVYNAANTWAPNETYDQSLIPQNFDWGYYVSNNPDLKSAGIDTLQEAQRHYGLYGRNEGRSPYEGYAQMAKGGAVKGYQAGGRTMLGYDSPETEADWQARWAAQQVPVEIYPVSAQPEVVSVPLPEANSAPLTVIANEPPPVSDVYPDANIPAPAVVGTRSVAASAPPPAAPALDARTAGLQSLLEQYGPRDGGYAQEVAAARQRAQAETTAFSTMLEKMMNSPEDAQTSKAEMYFRLAAAFGSPTKTGQFTENLALAGKELGEYAKGKRETSAKKRDLMLEVQKMKMGAAKDDLAAVRALEAESMKDRRAVAQELIKEYIASGKPQSSAGKQAMDMGLRPGTPEYQAKVEELARFDIERQMAGINNQLANLTLAQANLTLRQQTAARLGPTEIKMKADAEDLIANGEQSLKDLAEAYRLNPNTLAGGWLERGQQFLFEAAGSNDPTIVNTRVVNNLLGAQGLAKLRATFGGNPTEGERAILMELEGIGSKTREERAAIMRRAYRVLRDRVAREQRRVDDITSGAYRTTEPLPGGEQ